MASPPFRFKKFSIGQEGAAHPVGTDSVLLGAWADVSGRNSCAFCRLRPPEFCGFALGRPARGGGVFHPG